MADTPKIRFKGFADAWEQRKLGEICESFEYGLNAAAKEYDGENKYIRITDIDDNSHEFLQENVTSPDTELVGAENYRLKYGDILFARTGASVGKTYIYKDSDGLVYYAGFLIRGRVKDGFAPEFVFQNTLTEDYEKFIRITSQRSGQPGVNAQEYADFEISMPIYEEQKKIGQYFTHIDALIIFHQHKCNEIKELKKYMLQKMFPRNGKKNSEIRFAGFTDDWEQRKLEDISDVRDGTHDSPTYQNEGHPFVTSKNVKGGFINYDDVQYISDEDFEEINKRSKVDVNDILMGMIGTIGNLALIRTEPDFAIKNVALIKDTQQVSYLYLYHYLQSKNVEKQLLSGMDGGTQKFFALKKIRELNILVPSEDEQLQIGGFLENLDYLITLHQRKCDDLKEVKKFMLQNMFPQKG